MSDDHPDGQPGQGEGPQPQDPYGPPPAQPSSQPYGQSTPPPPYAQPYGQSYGQPYAQSYGQPYGQPSAQQPYGQPAYPQPGYPGYQRREDGGAQAAMVVGIASLALGLTCGVGLLGSPVAFVLGLQAKRRIDASNGQLGGRGSAQAGFVLGIVGTVLLVLLILALIAFVAIVLSVDSGQLDDGTGTAA